MQESGLLRAQIFTYDLENSLFDLEILLKVIWWGRFGTERKYSQRRI